MQYRLAILGIIKATIGAIIVAAFATGCPKSGADDDNQAALKVNAPPAASASANGSETPASDSDITKEANDASEAQADEDAGDELIAAGDSLVFPERKGDPSLEGKWFALFGHHDLGLMKHAWVDGHNVEFRQNGQAFWYKVVNGAEVDTMDSQWSTQGNNQLKLSFSAAKAVESGLSKLAPMGIGSDEEIGLASGNVSGGNTSAMVLLDSVMDMQLDHNYLVIRDSYSRLMVYGREPGENLEIPDEIQGAWVGKGAYDRQFNAQFELKGQELDVVNDRRTTEFSGVYAQGYFVGEMISTNGLELVAFYYDNDLGFIDGVRYAKPFRVVTMEYEFVKAPDSV